ncbi:MAG: ATP-binding protein [Polyangiaceae bacterium]
MEQAILDALYFVANKGWTESPQSYFNALVSFLGTTLSATWALVDELDEERFSARTVGMYGNGTVLQNFEYALAGTPCENVMGRKLCCYAQDVQRQFPDDRLLVDMGAESYIGIPLWSSNGEPIGLIAVLWTTPLSATMRETAENVLQIVALRCAHELDTVRHESRLREYSELLDELMDGFYFADCQKRFRDVNATFCEMTGYGRIELAKLTFFDLVVPDFLDETRRHVAEVVTKGKGRFETRLRRKDERTIDIEASALYWPSRGGRFAVTVRDVTEQKRTERERTALETRLYHAQRLEAVGRLAGGVAHDFNNMLAVILGQAELLLSDPTLAPGMRESLLDVRGAAERSAALTSQLLAFARKQRTTPKVLDVNAAIERMLHMLKRLLGEHIDLVWKPTHELWNVRVDPTQFDQIVANLCVNARDAMPNGGHLSISTTQGSHARTLVDSEGALAPGDLVHRDYVCLAVSDTGCGMDEDTKKHVFEPFFSTKGGRSGPGLGLATVYGVVTQNGGFVEVDSTPGKGSTFRLYFPRCPSDAISGTVPTRRLKPSTERVSILLVEDEPRVMRLIATMLKTLGYEVFTAAGPLEALQVIHRLGGEISLLLTDVVMPDMNGRQLFEQVRALYPKMRCLYMSGYSAEIIAGQGVLEDGTRLVQKPFKAAELEEAIALVLRDDRETAESIA